MILIDVFDFGRLITSRVRAGVIGLFVRHPGAEFGIRETARQIGSNPMAVRGELALLEGSGLLKSRKVANSIQYSLREDGETVEALRRLVGVGNT